MGRAILTISSKNYSAWSLRGWLFTRWSGLPFDESVIPPEDVEARAEILLLSSSIRVPRLQHEGVDVWDTLAIAEYLHEVCPQAGLLPKDRSKRAHCRSIAGEMHAGFSSLRSALPMNIKKQYRDFHVWDRAQADIDRVTSIWRDCLSLYGGPYLFGELTMADAMYAPVVTRLKTYDVKVDKTCAAYCTRMLAMPDMKAWASLAHAEPEAIRELEIEF
jgi:glutathione S-transferase